MMNQSDGCDVCKLFYAGAVVGVIFSMIMMCLFGMLKWLTF